MAKGCLRSMRIEPAQNGYTVHTEMASKPSKGGSNQAMPWEPSKPAVFTDKADVLAHVGKMLGGHEGEYSDSDVKVP